MFIYKAHLKDARHTPKYCTRCRSQINIEHSKNQDTKHSTQDTIVNLKKKRPLGGTQTTYACHVY